MTNLPVSDLLRIQGSNFLEKLTSYIPFNPNIKGKT